MKLIQIARNLFHFKAQICDECTNRNREEIMNAIAEAELMERKAKAFDWLINRGSILDCLDDVYSSLEAVEAAMKKLNE